MGAGHSHGPGHAHGHSHGGSYGAENQKRLAVVLGLSAAYMVAEVVGGLLTNSLALLADAGHMLSDVAALALSMFAIWIAQRPATAKHTYGFSRTEILAALLNGATLVAVSAYIFVEAYRRIGEPPEVQGALMVGIALGGLAVNLAGLWILSAGRSESLNVRGAWLHVLTDALGSVGAIAAGGLIWAFGWNWADPAASVLIGVLVLYSSWALLKETVAVLMEGAPGHIDVDEVSEAIKRVPGVRAVHDLHVWTITSGLVAMSGHVVVDEEHFGQAMLREIREPLHDRFGIDHATIQLEQEGFEEPALAV
ncbi:MAG TPA: cation diffusion facilitator family transporter [Longimicrobiaceae bacterium]|nr:cation diffusion facilitator family transporter [Longimicrobiaceae bacterium]